MIIFLCVGVLSAFGLVWCLLVVCGPSGLLLVWGVVTVAGQAWGSSCAVLRGSCSHRCLPLWDVLVLRVCWGVVASFPESVAQSLGAVGWRGGGAVRRRWISSEVVGSRNSIRMFQTPSVSSKSNLSPTPSNIAPSSVADNGGASVTMKNQCVAVRGAHRPWSPIVKTDLSWSPPLRIRAVGAWAYDELPAAMGKLCDRPHTGIR